MLASPTRVPPINKQAAEHDHKLIDWLTEQGLTSH